MFVVVDGYQSDSKSGERRERLESRKRNGRGQKMKGCELGVALRQRSGLCGFFGNCLLGMRTQGKRKGSSFIAMDEVA